MISQRLFFYIKKIEKILNIKINLDSINFEELLYLEKNKLGFKKKDLVFVSAGDFSKFYWCPMQTFLICKKNELEKYIGFFEDKIIYFVKLYYLKNPKILNFIKYFKLKYNSLNQFNNNDLIKIGENIELEDIFELLIKDDDFKNNKNLIDINLAKENLKNIKDPKIRGHLYETIYAKKYNFIHWVKRYKNFIFTCSPDGISNSLVYEFKSSKNRYFANKNIKKAKLQADIYGICFNKKIKFCENFIISENKLESIKEEIDFKEINKIINKFNLILKGFLPNPPKEEFKCLNCEFKNICEIKLD